jgi:hypothetical protein
MFSQIATFDEGVVAAEADQEVSDDTTVKKDISGDIFEDEGVVAFPSVETAEPTVKKDTSDKYLDEEVVATVGTSEDETAEQPSREEILGLNIFDMESAAESEVERRNFDSETVEFVAEDKREASEYESKVIAVGDSEEAFENCFNVINI